MRCIARQVSIADFNARMDQAVRQFHDIFVVVFKLLSLVNQNQSCKCDFFAELACHARSEETADLGLSRCSMKTQDSKPMPPMLVGNNENCHRRRASISLPTCCGGS